MRSSGAVFMKDSEEFIYSDSAYFMDMETGLFFYNNHFYCSTETVFGTHRFSHSYCFTSIFLR